MATPSQTPLPLGNHLLQAIVQGWTHGAFEIHFPKRFTWMMKLLRLLPNPWYFAAIRRLTRL